MTKRKKPPAITGGSRRIDSASIEAKLPSACDGDTDTTVCISCLADRALKTGQPAVAGPLAAVPDVIEVQAVANGATPAPTWTLRRGDGRTVTFYTIREGSK